MIKYPLNNCTGEFFAIYIVLPSSLILTQYTHFLVFLLKKKVICRKERVNQSYCIIRTFDFCRTLLKYLRTFLHENAVLTIGLTDQSGYSICLLYGQSFHPYSMSELVPLSPVVHLPFMELSRPATQYGLGT